MKTLSIITVAILLGLSGAAMAGDSVRNPRHCGQDSDASRTAFR
jgi:hypothetical protein